MKIRDHITQPVTVRAEDSSAAARNSADDLWWKSPFRLFQTNIREIDAGMDVERVVDRIAEYGSNAWLLSVGGIISNYPTNLPHQSRNPHLKERDSGDLIADALAAAQKRGIRVLARMDFSKVARPIAERHPEWCYIAPDGSRQVYNSLTSVCPNGVYYQEKVFEVLAEVLDHYEIDGFFFNWISYNEFDYQKRYRGVCHCLACHAEFGPELGGVLPTGTDSPNYLQWQQLAYSRLETYLGRVRGYISGRRPDAPFILGDTSDIIFHEANNAVGRELWPHHTSENVGVAKGFRPKFPVLVNAVAFLDMPYRVVSEEPRLFEQYLLQAAARGANLSTYIMGVPDDFDYDSLSAGSRITKFFRDNVDVYTGLRPASRTAIVRSDLLRTTMSDDSSSNAHKEFRGTWNALLERHIPFDVLPERRLAELVHSGALDRYALLVLPGLGRMNVAATHALDSWVERGGTLLITGSTGLDGRRSQFESSGVASRTVTMDTPETTWSSALVSTGAPTLSTSLPILGEFHVVEAKEGVVSTLSVLSRAPYGPPEKCYGHIPLDFPARLDFSYGQGRTLTLPWTPGRAYHEVGLSAVGGVLADAARELLGANLEIGTDLPSQVEVIVGESASGFVVHLRNLTGLRTQSFGDPVPISAGHRLSLRHHSSARVRALVAGVELEVERGTDSDGGITIELPRIELFEVLTVVTG